jgi:hypothetical protein
MFTVNQMLTISSYYLLIIIIMITLMIGLSVYLVKMPCI